MFTSVFLNDTWTCLDLLVSRFGELTSHWGWGLCSPRCPPHVHIPLLILGALLAPAQSLSRVWLCNAVDCSTPGFPALRYLPELLQTQGNGVSDAIQPSHPLWPPSPPALNLSQHQGLFQWVGSSHQVAKVLELQLQHEVSSQCLCFFWLCKYCFWMTNLVYCSWISFGSVCS